MMKKVIIKIGTGVLTRVEDGQLDDVSLLNLVTAVAGLITDGHEVMLISSGAVGAGISGLGLTEYPSDVPTRQACAAVGQTRLMHAYETLFRQSDLSVAQLLLTWDDFNHEERIERVHNTLDRLAEAQNIVPIINENDTVAVRELSLGDNDMLSALVSKLLKPDLLILLTSVDGLMPPEGGAILPEVADVNEVMDFAHGDSGKFSIGGMATKLEAVKCAVDAGVTTVIANGEKPERLRDIVAANENAICTRFLTK